MHRERGNLPICHAQEEKMAKQSPEQAYKQPDEQAFPKSSRRSPCGESAAVLTFSIDTGARRLCVDRLRV